MSTNYPPGVSGHEPQIVGDEAWESVHEGIDEDAAEHGMTDQDVYVAWSIGVAAWRASRHLGARWPHDPPPGPTV